MARTRNMNSLACSIRQAKASSELRSDIWSVFLEESANILDGFCGLVVSMLASGIRVRGFKPGRSRWIFRASEKSSASLPSEGK